MVADWHLSDLHPQITHHVEGTDLFAGVFCFNIFRIFALNLTWAFMNSESPHLPVGFWKRSSSRWNAFI